MYFVSFPEQQYVRWMYQPVSSLSGVVVITAAPSVKMHWYTPVLDRLKLVIVSSLDWLLSTVPSVMIMFPPLTTCSPFLTHTTEGGVELSLPTHLNTWLLPTVTAVRLSKVKPSLSAGWVTTVSVLVLAAEIERPWATIKCLTNKGHNSQAYCYCELTFLLPVYM